MIQCAQITNGIGSRKDRIGNLNISNFGIHYLYRRGRLDAAVSVAESDHQMRQIDLGSISADISGTAAIYINGTIGGDDRRHGL